MTRLEKIASLYLSIFGREPAVEDLDYYVTLNENIPLETISTTMYNSEGALILPSDYEILVKATFQTVFGYTSAEMDVIISQQAQLAIDGGIDGFQYWVNELENNPMVSKETIIIALINGASDEDSSKAIALTTDVLATYQTYLDQSSYTINGTTDNDLLNGNEVDNIINGFEGNDTIITNIGNNIVYGGTGLDTITGNEGDDELYGEEGNDTIYAGEGNDILYGELDNDYLHGELGDDILFGGLGNDYLYGEEGNDVIYGNEGDDVIQTGEGDNIVYAGDGSDYIYLGTGLNLVDGGLGNDYIYGNISVDEIYGGEGDDTIYSYEENDKIDGLAGNDTVFGGLGDDILNGNEDNDVLYGGDGNDTLYGESGNDIIIGGNGADIISSGSGNDTIVFYSKDSDYFDMDTILDFDYNNDKLRLDDKGDEIINEILESDNINTVFSAIDLLCSEDGSINGIINWFIYDEYTYLVYDQSIDNTFNYDNDIVFRFQGIVGITAVDFQFV